MLRVSIDTIKVCSNSSLNKIKIIKNKLAVEQ